MAPLPPACAAAAAVARSDAAQAGGEKDELALAARDAALGPRHLDERDQRQEPRPHHGCNNAQRRTAGISAGRGSGIC